MLWYVKLVRGVKAFLSTLTDQNIIDASAGLFIVTGVSMLLLHYARPQVGTLAIGSVAASEIIAPDNIKVEDSAETQKRRALAAQGVLPVFEYNRNSRDLSRAIEQLFEVCRDAKPGAQPSDLIEQIQQLPSGLILDREQLAVLSRHRYNAELEKLMINHLEAVMSRGVVNSRSHLLRIATNGFVRRRGGEETIVSDLSSIRDLMTARAALRSERVVWPSEYLTSERRLLGEILGSLIIPNLEYDEAETEARRKSSQDSIPPVMLSVEKGKPIVVEGETVTPAKAALLEAATRYSRFGQRTVEFAGTLIIVMMLLLVLWQYMVRYQQRHLRVRRHFLLQITAFVITLALARVMFQLATIISRWASHSPFTAEQGWKYLAPLAVGAVLVTLLTDVQAAFVFSAILAVFIGVLSGNVYLSAFTLMTSVGAIHNLKGCRERTTLMWAGLSIGLINAASALALDLLGAADAAPLVLIFDSLCALLGGLVSTMIASVLLPVFEWAFEITTDIKLLELSNLNLPLLKQLAERAPGTYHHSIMVGLLAESGAEAIEGDALFARVACYYHDIGKMLRPTYFVENQSYMENRHDKLSPKMSSIVLANHVKQGVELGRQHKLPPRIIAIIPQHHGTGLMKFFYFKARGAAESAPASLEHDFRYPGPKPQTKEAAIIMIADSVEAAARTVKSPTPGKLRNMIDTIISRLRDDGQFDECSITLRELNLVAESFVKVLTGIHHHRIAYPGYDFDKAGAATEERSAAASAGATVARKTGALGVN